MVNNYWQSKHIKLRALEKKDLQMYLQRRSNPDSKREIFWDYMPFPLSIDETKKDFEELFSEQSVDDKRTFIIETFDEKYVGEIYVWKTNKRNGVMCYGIFIEEEYKGQGLGKEALIIVLDYYFNELNYQKAAPTAYSFNISSQRFHEKFGFIKEGELRSEVYVRGKYHNMICYGMLKSEFNSMYKHEFVDI